MTREPVRWLSGGLGAIKRAALQPSRTRIKVLGVLAALVAFGCWAVASPVGASPDEDFHLASIWCSHGIREGICEPGSTETARMVPALLTTMDCYAFKPDISAACQDSPEVDDGMSASEWWNYQGLYPPVFYWVNGLFATTHVTVSVILMRLFNALLFVGLIVAIALAVPAGLRRAMIGGAVVTVVPLGMFLIPSVNPSSWGLLAAATVLVSVLGYLTAETRKRRVQLGVLAGLSLLIGAGARADAAIFAVVAITAAIILTAQPTRQYLRLLIIPGILVVIGVVSYLVAGQSSHADIAQSGQVFSRPRLISIVLDVPALWIGGLGTWGLGWLDTVMPPIVWVSSWSVFVMVVFVAVTGARLRRGLAIGLVAFAALAIPTYVQFLSGYPVGAVIQARYILPLLTILAVAAMVRLDGAPFRLTNGQRWIVVALLSIANAVALESNLRRYVTGTDIRGYNLDNNVEWWWGGFASPMTIWLLAVVAFTAAAVLLTKDFTDSPQAEPGPSPSADVPIAELPEPPATHDGERGMVGAILARMRGGPRGRARTLWPRGRAAARSAVG